MSLFLFLITSALIAISAEPGPQMSKVTQEIERIHSMRESLVSSVQGDVTSATFKAVCKPVGMELKKLGKKLGVQVGQTSSKYRNPNHKPNPLEKDVMQKMERDKTMVSMWKQSGGKLHYFRRIEVQKACLNCHGDPASRPDFIKKKYPQDKAFGFKVGDLRGIYHVMMGSKD